jgi:hypothetical protein
MSSSVFDNKSFVPDDTLLQEALGKTNETWEDIKKYIIAKYPDIRYEWKYYSQKSGWILKVLSKKRNLFFVVPQQNYFRISFVFGDKAVDVIDKSDLPNEIKTTLRNAQKYAEGRGLRLEVKDKEHVKNIKKLIEIKIKN